MTPKEIEALSNKFERDPYRRYKKWTYTFDHPGYFVYYHDKFPLNVYFTPGHSKENVVDIQINYGDDVVESQWMPFYSNDAADLFAIVRQWLDFAEANVQGGKKQKDVLDWRPDQLPWTPMRET